MFHETLKKKGGIVPECLYQKQLTTKIAVSKSRWALKAVTIRGDPEILGLISLSLYDIKPLYVMSNEYYEIRWRRTRQVCHKLFKITF